MSPSKVPLHSRDKRIDFFRGLALYMILVDHIAGDPLARFTYHAIGFSDAAEIFVFLSGMVCGIAYTKLLVRHGWSAVVSIIAARGVRIYLYYLVSGGVVILSTVIAERYWNVAPRTDPLAAASQNPWTVAMQLINMAASPADTGILVLYIALTAIVVPLFLLAGRAYALFALGISAVVWIVSPILERPTGNLTGGWYLNPFAWQLLFAIGMVAGMGMEADKPRPFHAARSTWFIRAAWAIVIAAFVYKLAAFLARNGGYAAWFVMSTSTLQELKRHLSALRLVHFLSVAILIAIYVPKTAGFLNWRATQPVIWSGVHSLQLFSLSVVLSNLDNIFVAALQPQLAARLLIDVLSISLMAAVAYALTYAKLRAAQHC